MTIQVVVGIEMQIFLTQSDLKKICMGAFWVQPFVKIGDFPPELVVTNIDEDDDDYYASMGY